MSANVKLDFKTEEVKILIGADVEIYNEGDTESVVITMDQFETLSDKYFTANGEPTREELEEKIQKLENHVSELQEYIETQEEYEQLKKDKYCDNEVF